MDHQGAPNVHFHHYTLAKSELTKNWPSSGPRLSRISTNYERSLNIKFLLNGIALICNNQLSHSPYF